MSFKSNPLIYIGIAATLLLHIIVTETFLSQFLKIVPIPFEHIKYIFIMALPILVVIEIYKKLKGINMNYCCIKVIFVLLFM